MRLRSVIASWMGLACCVSACVLAACSDDELVAPEDNPLCVQDCPTRGVISGSAAISGVASVDTFFAAVVGQSSGMLHTAAAIELELAALRAAFGASETAALGAEIRRLAATQLASGPTVVAGSALCWVDAARLLAVQSLCDPELEVGETLACRGPCRVLPGVDCGRLATLQCTLPSLGAGIGTDGEPCADLCSGTCQGTPDQAGRCQGACVGECDGRCERFERDGAGALRCAGNCDGMCRGSCVRAIERGTCRDACVGQCIREAPAADVCDGASEVRCQPNPGRVFACPGECAGVFDAPSGKAECTAAAQAEAALLARCDTPPVSVHYVGAADADDAAGSRYASALEELQRRLPALLANVARARALKASSQTLATSAGSSVRDSLRDQSKDDALPVADRTGLACAIEEATQVGKALQPAQRKLDEALSRADELLVALGLS